MKKLLLTALVALAGLSAVAPASAFVWYSYSPYYYSYSPYYYSYSYSYSPYYYTYECCCC